MAVGYGVAAPKPARTIKQLKARAKRQKGNRAADVRIYVFGRDGFVPLLPEASGGFDARTALPKPRRESVTHEFHRGLRLWHDGLSRTFTGTPHRVSRRV